MTIFAEPEIAELDELCEECWHNDWRLVERGGTYHKVVRGLFFRGGGGVVWECQRCGSQITQEAE